MINNVKSDTTGLPESSINVAMLEEEGRSDFTHISEANVI